jgi:hypothetical protein
VATAAAWAHLGLRPPTPSAADAVLFEVDGP